MHLNKVNPRKNIHNFNQNRIQGIPSYHGNWYPCPVKEYYITPQNENIKNETPQDPKKNITVRSKLFQIFQYYCAKTSVPGLQYIGSREYNKLERSFWLFSSLAAICFAAYFITSLYENFKTNPVIVSYKPTRIQITEIPFPTITICNVNLATKTEAERILKNGTEVDKRLLNELCDLKKSFKNTTYDGETTEWQTVRKFIITVNQKCSEMFKLCKWEGKAIPCDDYINSVLTDEGYCCSFNGLPSNYSLREVLPGDLNETYPGRIIDWNPEDGYPSGVDGNILPLKSSGPGVHLGLTLVLDADLDEYYCSSVSSVGFKVRMTNPIDTPRVSDFGFLLSPGIEARIPIEPTIQEAHWAIQDINLRKRKCLFGRERKLVFYRFYTERNCRLECQAIYTLKKCGCVPYYLPKNESMKICDKRTEKCTTDAQTAIENLGTPQRKKCNCLPGCFSITYQRRVFSTGELSTKYKLVNDAFLQNDTLEHFANNKAIAHFYYELDKYKVEMKSELYGFSEFMSNTGGLMGVFLGFSFLSGVEIIYFLLFKSFCLLCRIKKNKQKKIIHGVNGIPYFE